jgi:hypothetical protein
LRTLRWIVTFPAATLIGYLAYLVGGTINNFATIIYFGAPLDGWQRIVADATANAFLGAAMVYSAIRIAPSAPRLVASAATGLLTIVAVASLWSSFMIGKFDALSGIGGVMFGALAVLYATLDGQVIPYRAADTNN